MTATKTKRPAQSQANQKTSAILERTALSPVEEKPAARFAKTIEAVRQAAKDTLDGYFKNFLDEASPEEIHIMNRIMVKWDNYPHPGLVGQAYSPVIREVPILCAFQEEVDGNDLVSVPNEHMVPYVESFIVELGERWQKVEEARVRSQSSPDDRAYDYLRKELSVFVQDAGEESINFMRKLLARWSQLQRDPAVRAAIEVDANANLLMSAAEIEAGRLGASHAVQLAIHTT